MKFSVIIPLYNKKNSIRRAIYSVFDQVGSGERDCELVVVDDGSNDGSLEVVNKIQCEHTDREIIVYSQANAGVSAARNKGAELASADFLTFLDADDTYEPNFLSEIESLMDNFPDTQMLATAYRFIDTNAGQKRNARIIDLDFEQQILDDYFYSAAYGDLPVTSSSVCINKYALKEVGGFPVGEHMGEDQAVWSQIALRYSIAISKKICANYFEDSTSSLMQTIPPSGEMPFSKRLQQQLDDGEISSRKVPSIETYIAGHLLDLVRRNLKAGDVNTAKLLSQDLRARRRPKRWVHWYLRVQMASVLRFNEI